MSHGNIKKSYNIVTGHTATKGTTHAAASSKRTFGNLVFHGDRVTNRQQIGNCNRVLERKTRHSHATFGLVLGASNTRHTANSRSGTASFNTKFYASPLAVRLLDAAVQSLHICVPNSNSRLGLDAEMPTVHPHLHAKCAGIQAVGL